MWALWRSQGARLGVLPLWQTGRALSIACLLALAGCGGREEPPWSFSYLFDEETVALVATPNHFTDGANVKLVIRFTPLYRGVGRIDLIGHGGGLPVAQVLQPVQGGLGHVAFEDVEFLAHSPLELVLQIEMTSQLRTPAIAMMVEFDSVMVDDEMFPVASMEASTLFGPGFPLTSIYRDIALHRDSE